MFIYCICTQYLVGAPFALITGSTRRGMEVISLWHCDMKVVWSPGFFDSGLQLICMFWSLVSHFPLDNTSYILYVQVWWVCCIFKKLVSRNVLVNECSDVGFQKTQWTLNYFCHFYECMHKRSPLNNLMHFCRIKSIHFLKNNGRLYF